ncbi:APX3, partial [Symbiodinium sp. CCMP2456]
MTKGSNSRVAQAMALASAAAAGSAFSMMAAPEGSQSRIVARASGPSPLSAPSSSGVAGVAGLVGTGLVASAALSRSVKPRGGKKNLVSMAARGGESYDALVKDLETLVKEKECGPILVRLSWHDAGVFSDGKLKGGCPNAAMRFTDAGEGTFGANAGFNFSVQLVLLHGGHLQNLDTFNQILDMKKYSPSRAIWGTRHFFCAVISKELLLNGAYELPYNMPPGLASTRGHPGLTISLTGLGGGLENQPQTVQYDGDLALAELDKGGQAFWQSQGFDT